MDLKRLEQIAFITNDILTNPSVDYITVANTGKLASEDDYLYNMLIDWAKEIDVFWKAQMLDEILNYTEEKLRSTTLSK